MNKKLTFQDLWVGDRFEAVGSLWTKIGASTARKHSKEGLALNERSYGYIGDTICSFEREDFVIFVPASSDSPITLSGKMEALGDNYFNKGEPVEIREIKNSKVFLFSKLADIIVGYDLKEVHCYFKASK